MTVSEKIRLTRQQKKLSRGELSKISGVNLKSLSRYELGTTVPPADVLKSIADALEVSTDYLVSENGQVQIKDKELFKKFELIQEMECETKSMIMNFLDLAIRGFKAKQAYAS
ncbi:helix-turn-helix domain-containing protein [Cyclobacterium plantarum]|uniref:Helix-turn-helix transcriptional regulator n=1 Tax=Cyclobacterium plantarum TaxID=2716263 RepID=A0ABX0H7G6_9BACT|nr:helix-turn-helix transcriptional regulator [Cyclobacterium plantarum]NHE56328.1 helix-turn-helix transcriptional regulator [Cyclobacterium plantarum]